MTKSIRYPKIKRVKTPPEKKLLVEFENGVIKLYDCTPLLQQQIFQSLRDEAFFQCARADSHGYGVIWNDEIDIAESEVWINGQIANLHF
ncbi:MAG: hypothetical protein A2161_02130 [Candidatus Schekmanbacteria bacterium RBG_13_48_7]|uniref:DUF2442 domain-containing protein n=1 Tax=Candidatus Schekmanbacteria bacterium RBG_13_48_7 TaxID=1817878 RepID=A0A1F7RUQ7_9BACT|nr:MAG: hypothetical protein A2161_02130 [Candidatus Schekmanbacteria bacterium RBG_13_48_7]